MNRTINKTSLIAIIVLIVTIVCVVATSSTYAVWQRIVTSTKEIEIPVADYNPSLKYLKFTGLNSDGDFATTGITQYAVVGYEGLVAEVIIPSVYTVGEVDYPVVMITTDPDKTEYRFSNNEVITSLIIPVSVIQITDATFAGLTELTQVTLLGTAEDASINIERLVFGGCQNLSTFTCARPIIGDSYSFLWGTQLL